MGARSKRLFRVAEHAGAERDAAARQLAAARDTLERSEAQLRSLRDYVVSYRREMASVQQDGSSAARLRNYTDFLAQLTLAVRHQEKLVEQARADVDRQTRQWIDSRARVVQLETAAEKCASRERANLERKEQNALDDLVMARFLERQT
jgi:flagellar export protein FliJ